MQELKDAHLGVSPYGEMQKTKNLNSYDFERHFEIEYMNTPGTPRTLPVALLLELRCSLNP